MKRTMILVSIMLLMSTASLLLGQGPSDCGENLETLVIGSNFSGVLGYPPFEVFNADVDPNMVSGFDIAVACEVAHRLGFKRVTFRQVAFSDLLPQVAEGTIDSALAALSITEERNQAPLSFVKYNDDDNLGVVVTTELANNNPRITDPEQTLQVLNDLFNGTSLVGVSVLGGSRQQAILEPRTVYTELVPFAANNVTESLALVENGALLALFTNGPTARDLAATNPSNFVAVQNVVVAPSADVPSVGIGIALNSECCQLYANVAQAIKDMEADGTLPALRAEFNVGTFTPVNLTPTSCASAQPDLKNNQLFNWLYTHFCPRCSS